MLELINKTPFNVNFTPVTTLQGFDALAVFMSASFELMEGKWQLCDEQIPTPLSDKYWDEEQPSSIRYPSQISLEKPATDVIVNGVAVSPNQQTSLALEASVEIGEHHAAVHVYGDRVWHRGRISNPRPFQRMPIVWENAFGGRELVEDVDVSYEHNPLGKGWRPENTPREAYDGTFMPNIEWPHQLIQSPGDTPMPAGFAALPLDTPARAQYAGTYDAQWKQQRAPFLPQDFNPAFFNSAIPALQIEAGLQGGESVRLVNLHETSELVFNLPVVRAKGDVMLNTGTQTLDFSLLTVLIESENGIVRLFGQAMVPIQRTVADIRAIKVALAGSY